MNAGGLSAFNPVERRMALLCKIQQELYFLIIVLGIIQIFKKTIDRELEIKHFQAAAKLLSEFWKKTVIDGYPVNFKAAFFGNMFEPLTPDTVWVAKHCCSVFKRTWLKTFPDRFIPFPCIYEYANNYIIPVEPSRYFKSLFLPNKVCTTSTPFIGTSFS